MSRFLDPRFSGLRAYTPGEQPKSRLIKLNTNESPFPPAPGVAAAVNAELSSLNLYPDPTCEALRQAAAELFRLKPENFCFVNGSDEALEFAFMAFCGTSRGAVFPDITYGFYPVYAQLFSLDYTEIPLTDGLSVRPGDYYASGRTIFLANPNAPTGIALSSAEILEIVRSNPDSVVVVDEAYVDFGGESVLPFITDFPNLLVIRTFSKSRSFAGGRLGFAVGSAPLIADLELIKYSTNPYNIDRLTQAAGAAALRDTEYFEACRKAVIAERERLSRELVARGFRLTESCANFVFAEHPGVSGEELAARLRAHGVLVRRFGTERIKNRLRITVGSAEQTTALLAALDDILKEMKGE